MSNVTQILSPIESGDPSAADASTGILPRTIPEIFVVCGSSCQEKIGRCRVSKAYPSTVYQIKARSQSRCPKRL